MQRLIADTDDAVAGQRRPRFRALQPLTPADVRTLAQSRWVTLGSHSHGHELLDRIALAEAADSITRSIALLRKGSGQDGVHSAYPNGNYNAALAAALPGLGLKSAVTTRHGLWRRDGALFELPRVAVGRYDDLPRLRLSLLG